MIDLMPKSPGISKNQNLKDRVLQEVYNKKIKELKSMQHLGLKTNINHTFLLTIYILLFI